MLNAVSRGHQRNNAEEKGFCFLVLCVGSAGSSSTCSFSSTQVLQCTVASSASSICSAFWLTNSVASIFPLDFLGPFRNRVPPVSESPSHEFSHILKGTFEASSMGKTSRKFHQCSITDGLAIQWAKAMPPLTRSGSLSGGGLFLGSSISHSRVMATSYICSAYILETFLLLTSQSLDTLIPCDN